MSRWVSLDKTLSAAKTHEAFITTAYLYHSDFFGVTSSRTVSRFDTVEVWGSSPHGPTILFNTLESFLRNPTETSPVILHL